MRGQTAGPSFSGWAWRGHRRLKAALTHGAGALLPSRWRMWIPPGGRHPFAGDLKKGHAAMLPGSPRQGRAGPS